MKLYFSALPFDLSSVCLGLEVIDAVQCPASVIPLHSIQVAVDTMCSVSTYRSCYQPSVQCGHGC